MLFSWLLPQVNKTLYRDGHPSQILINGTTNLKQTRISCSHFHYRNLLIIYAHTQHTYSTQHTTHSIHTHTHIHIYIWHSCWMVTLAVINRIKYGLIRIWRLGCNEHFIPYIAGIGIRWEFVNIWKLDFGLD